MASEDRNFGSDGPGFIQMGSAAMPRVFALGILANDYPVKVLTRAVPERGGSSAQDPGWANVGILLEGLTNGKSQSPQGNMVRYIFIYV
jgi:hypothetical protein